MNSKRPTQRSIIIKLPKTESFESRKREAMCHIQGTLNKITSKFFIRNFVGQRQRADIFKMLKENILSASFLGQP